MKFQRGAAGASNERPKRENVNRFSWASRRTWFLFEVRKATGCRIAEADQAGNDSVLSAASLGAGFDAFEIPLRGKDLLSYPGMSDPAPRVSLVIPCRNEALRLPATLRALGVYLDGAPFSAEVVVVIEPSQDHTVRLAREYAAGDPRVKVLANEVGRGKGYAVKTGMLAATGDLVFFMDADLSVPARFVGEFLHEFDGPVDVAFGSRRHPSSVVPVQQPFLREMFGRMFNLGLKVCGATRFADTQCGFKGFRREAAREVFSRLTLDGFGFDVEALALAEALDYRIKECPVEWNDAAGSKVRPLQDGISSFLEAVSAARRARKASRGRSVGSDRSD